MKPFKTFLFLACTLLVVAAVYLCLYAPDLSIELPKPSPAAPKSEKVQRQKAVRQQMQKKQRQQEEKEAKVLADVSRRWETDSLMLLYKYLYRLDTDIFENGELADVPLFPFEYDSAGAGKYLLQDFFAKLLALRNPPHADRIADWYEKPDFWNDDLAAARKSFVRVLHYGGSLIENDYVSGTLRQLMQRDFGGAGVGLLPLFQTNANFISVKRSGKWHVSQPSKSTPRGNFGVYGASLNPPPVNAFGQKTADKGFLRIRIPEKLQQQTLFLEAVLHDEVAGKQIAVTADRHKTPAQVLEVPGQQRYTYALPSGAKEVELTLTLSKNACLYALSLNDTTGVCVDNMSVKGYEGAVFSPNNRRFLINQMVLLNTGLVLYQFDGSAALRNKDYGSYRVLLMKELAYLRMLMPQTPVIVMGTASSGDIEQLTDIQRECAFACGCVFWNMNEALGGGNAMARWAEAQTPLVSRNLSHFTPRGAEWVGKLFYRSFLGEYRRFLLQERKRSMLQRAKKLISETPNPAS
ncbi:MAG: hypothetical protein NC048_01640 [Bacteroides sp.]|nr:hypothetical protein [Ruminococcus flavefaciens]MCM1554183.1 hypothetical protein [Bacteroides sp.]